MQLAPHEDIYFLKVAGVFTPPMCLLIEMVAMTSKIQGLGLNDEVKCAAGHMSSPCRMLRSCPSGQVGPHTYESRKQIVNLGHVPATRKDLAASKRLRPTWPELRLQALRFLSAVLGHVQEFPVRMQQPSRPPTGSLLQPAP